MDRKIILKKLIDERFNGSQADFGRAIGRSPSQVNQWLKGYRALGDAGAHLIEVSINLPRGYMDGKPQNYEFSQNSHDSYAPSVEKNSSDEQILDSSSEQSEHVAAVVALMNSTDDRGMRTIRLAAEQALDEYKLMRSKVDLAPESELELALLRSFRSASPEVKQMLLVSAMATNAAENTQSEPPSLQIAKKA